MVMEIPSAWEALNCPVTSRKVAPMRILSIEVHSMCLTLVAEEASVGRKSEIPAFMVFTLVGLQMRIQVFAMLISGKGAWLEGGQLTRNRTFAWWERAHIGFLWRMDIGTNHPFQAGLYTGDDSSAGLLPASPWTLNDQMRLVVVIPGHVPLASPMLV